MEGNTVTSPTWLDLYDYRNCVAAMYRERTSALIAGDDGLDVAMRFRTKKDSLFTNHPQSPMSSEERQTFQGLSYFPYDPAFSVEAILEPAEDSDEIPFETGASHTSLLKRAGKVTFTLAGVDVHLTVFWIDVYGGGLFLPFRDTTCPEESYGGGRYLFDTVKGSDFLSAPGEPGVASTQGYLGGRILLDFNYAYNPSCAYDVRWICPLAPRENWLHAAVSAGERKYHE